MKLTHGLTAALAGIVSAAGAQQSAQVYLLPSSDGSSSKSTPSIPASLARLVFLQRLSPFGKGPSTSDGAAGASLEEVVNVMNHFGKAPPPMHPEDAESNPQQLMLILEDMTTDQMAELGKQVKGAFKGMKPAFEIPNPPSTRAHDDLVEIDFYNAGLTSHTKCDVDLVIDPKNEKCWDAGAKSNVAKYNLEKDGKVLDKSRTALEAIHKLTKDGTIEVMLVALPAVESSTAPSWKADELRRRQAEEVMSGIDNEEEPAETSKAQEHDFFISSKAREPIPACFSSEDSCVEKTGNCSGHGLCQNRYAKPDGSDGKTVCYKCHCLSTVSDSGSLTHWAGNVCSKKDVSTPFWLFAGFTIVLVGILTLGIGMLFSVGEETLPGVIGAGVSRTSK